MSNCCSVCMQPLDGTDWLCHKCAETHEVTGVPYREWPDYLKVLVNEEQAARRRDKEIRELGYFELSFSDCPEAEILAYGETDEDDFLPVYA